MLKLSEKLKFSIKVSLSIVLAFLIPFSQGWEQVQTAGITIMLIAAMGSVKESIAKGALRVLGTLIGAVIGMTLIAIFPQERFLYLVSLSITVTLTLYLLRAYKGEPSAFMLSAMTMMMVFDNGEVADLFLYGVDKIYMSIFGILIYTLVSVFLWPEKIEDTTIEDIKELSLMQHKLFLKRDLGEEEYSKLFTPLLKQEELLQKASFNLSSSSMDDAQGQSIIHNYKNITKILALATSHQKEYTQFDAEISSLFEDITHSWETKKEIFIPKALVINYKEFSFKSLSHLQRASFISEIENIKKLHNELRALAQKLNALHSPLPTFFEYAAKEKQSSFVWGNIEHLKASLITFMIFWITTFIWIYFNPPGGFMIVTLATGLSVFTVYTSLKPSVLITVFSLSFIFAGLMYIFVLPNLHLAWELALFIFIYSLISFYILPQKLSIFFLIGLFLLNISNQMYYSFSLFLLILVMFYIFLMILQVFYYMPFSNKPEHMFLKLTKRFFTFAEILLAKPTKTLAKNTSWYAKAHLMHTLKNMKLFSKAIDFNYYNTIKQDDLETFFKECEKFSYFSLLMQHKNKKIKNNALLISLQKNNDFDFLNSIDSQTTREEVESFLSQLLSHIDFEHYSKEDIIEFYENINLRKNVYLAFYASKDIMHKIDFKSLKMTKF